MTDITIGDTRPFVQYAADGTQTAFTYPFAILAASDLVVVFDDGAAPGSHTIDGVGAEDGGTVTFDTAPASGVRITIYRDMPVERTTDFVESGEFRASALNGELDRLTMMIQQVEAAGANALRRAQHDTDGPLVVPPRTERINTVLAFDDAGWPTVLADPVLAASQASDSADAAAQSASDAADAASQAGQARDAAQSAAGDADASETAAAAAEAKAEQWADAAVDVEVETGAYSARHWAQKAEDVAVDMPAERWRTDLALQRVRWTLLVPAAARAPDWGIDFRLALGLDGLVVTRASQATYHDARGRLVTAAADELRLDHDPQTWRPLGALLESARTNHLYDSFNPATQTRSLPAGTYTLSVKGGGDCTMSGAASGTATEGAPVTFTLSASDSVTFTVNGTLQAFQCEDGSSATSLIETPVDGTATRAADMVTASDVDWLRTSSAALVITARMGDISDSDAHRLLALDQGQDSDRHNLYWNGGIDRMQMFTKSAGTSQGSLSALIGGWSGGEAHTLGMLFGGGLRKLFADGSKTGEDTVTEPAPASVLRIGGHHFGERWNGHVQRLAVWNTHLGDTEMADLTA